MVEDDFLRILIDYRPALRERTGVGEYVFRLVGALADRLSADRPAARHVPPDTSITLFSSSWKHRAPADSPWPILDRRIPVGLLNLLWHRLEWPSAELLTGRRFDIVHSPHPLLLPSRSAARVVTIHDLDFLVHPDWTRAEIRRDYPALVQAHASRADQIIVPSRHTARRVQDWLGVSTDRISICPHGAPPGWQPRGRPPSEGHFLFVGTLEPRKNVGGLLSAYAALLSRRPDAPDLVLVGKDTPDAASWLDALRRPPLAGRARYLGYVSDDERQRLYQGARLLVLPSFDEGFGLPVLEAMTLGVPVVASSRGALRELVGDAGLLVDPEDVAGLSAALEAVAFDAERARAMAASGIARARIYTWELAADHTLEAYRRARARALERQPGRTGKAA